ncbi:MAG: nucleotidyltransferase family protein, partial [Lachnospiraceae bacterium]|nr:nucleotidyltransferase family protein [Lachnospiraceae bacterium]
GSESGDLSALQALAGAIPADRAESDRFHEQLIALTKEGLTYTKAFAKALSGSQGDRSGMADPELLSSPNNLLAVEYLRSIALTESRIRPVTILRTPSSERITSATKIRRIIHSMAEDRSSVDTLAAFLPEATLREVREIIASDDLLGMAERTVSADDLSSILSYCLIRTDPAELSSFGDISESLANRIESLRLQCHGYESFAASIKSRSTTLARVRRCLMQLILGIKRDTREALLNDRCTALRVLGFRESYRDLLKELGAHASAPLITRGADFRKAAEQGSLAPLIRLDLTASARYDQLSVVSGERVPEEARPVVIAAD